MTAPLTAGEAAYFREHGGVDVDATPGGEPPSRAVAVAYAMAELLASTITVDRAADLLGIDRSGLTRRIQARELYAVRGPGGRLRVPTWQWTDAVMLPGLATVARAIPATANPLAVRALMTTPQDETNGETPQVWLARGGDANIVAELIASLGRW